MMSADVPELRDNDVAIIGVAGEFPTAPDLNDLWMLLFAKGLATTSIASQHRWPIQEDTGYCQHAAFIENAHCFDPVFFSIAPVQALYSDPQERRLLQTAYHALENSGYFQRPHGDVGVYTAAMYPHYQNFDTSPFFGTSFAQIANRISHRLDLHGPSLCVDTMCSGSLVALHLASTALRQGECRIALVGAANIHTSSGKFRLLCQGGYLSRTGRCHSFGASADGYVPGEGSVAIVLKCLAQAQADGDSIHGVIRGSAVGSDGGAGPFTVPDADAQADVMRRALEQSAVTSDQVSYVECHGTGTPVGDPVEIKSLAMAYRKTERAIMPIGSIKANIGHLEAAAGLAGLIKVLLQMRHQTLLPHIGATPPNSDLNLQSVGLELVSEPRPWKGPCLAGINSFGAGGTNAHIIVQSAPASMPPQVPKGAWYLFPLSGNTSESLKKRLTQLTDWIDANPTTDLYAIGYTLSCAREHHRHRVCVAAESMGSLRSALEAALNKSSHIKHESAAATTLSDDAKKLIAAYQRGESVRWGDMYSVKFLVDLPPFPFSTRHFDAVNGPLNEGSASPAVIGTVPTSTRAAGTKSLLSWQNIHGEGRTVLLLSPTNVSTRAWHCQVEFLRRKGFNLMIPSLPGHDGNCMPAQPFSLVDIAAEIAGYLDKTAAGPVHCAGWSLGAAVALHLALDHRSTLDSLCLISGSARFTHGIPHMLSAFKKENLLWEEFISLQLDLQPEGQFTFLAGATNKDLMRYYPLLRDHDVRDRLAQITVRSLVIHGIDDQCITDQECEHLGSINSSIVKLLPGGHLLPITASKALNNLLLEHFL